MVFSQKLAGNPTIIAEVAQAHDGSLGTAHALVEAAARAGADGVKFQTHIAAAESTLDEPWRVKFSPQDKTRFDYWRRMEFSPGQWGELAVHARELGLIFVSSPFSVRAVELLEGLEVPFWKIASGEVANPELLEAVWATGRPVVFSSGMSDLKELDRAVEETRQRGAEVAVLQCTTAYPCPPQQWGLNVMARLKERYRCPVGFSDHSGDIHAGLAATALGAEMIEVHLTFHRRMFGPDVPASLTVEDLARLVEGARAIRSALDNPVDKNDLSPELNRLKTVFGRSWALAHNLSAGTVLTREHLSLKKPGGGIPVSDLDRLLGRRLRLDKTADRLLAWEDLDPDRSEP